jgi:hypothetical protein
MNPVDDVDSLLAELDSAMGAKPRAQRYGTPMMKKKLLMGFAYAVR